MAYNILTIQTRILVTLMENQLYLTVSSYRDKESKTLFNICKQSNHFVLMFIIQPFLKASH